MGKHSVAKRTKFQKCHRDFQHPTGIRCEQSETALLWARGWTGWLSKVLSKLKYSMILKRKNKPRKRPKSLWMLFHDPFVIRSWQHQINYLSKINFKMVLILLSLAFLAEQPGVWSLENYSFRILNCNGFMKIIKF